MLACDLLKVSSQLTARFHEELTELSASLELQVRSCESLLRHCLFDFTKFPGAGIDLGHAKLRP